MTVPEHFSGHYYTKFLAELCRRRNTRYYLEIGVMSGESLAGITCEVAIGVDPSLALAENVATGKSTVHLYQMTSDKFFSEVNVRSVLGDDLDMAFLDGLHLFEVLLRDFYNTESVCSSESLIAIHDCMPLAPEMMERDLATGVPDGPFKGYWTGDVWKLIPILKKHRPDLNVSLVDCPPTGLVLVTSLDPNSRVLQERYPDIVQEFASVPNDGPSMRRLYEENRVTPSASILEPQA
jgi:hypothetical protein